MRNIETNSKQITTLIVLLFIAVAIFIGLMQSIHIHEENSYNNAVSSARTFMNQNSITSMQDQDCGIYVSCQGFVNIWNPMDKDSSQYPVRYIQDGVSKTGTLVANNGNISLQ